MSLLFAILLSFSWGQTKCSQVHSTPARQVGQSVVEALHRTFDKAVKSDSRNFFFSLARTLWNEKQFEGPEQLEGEAAALRWDEAEVSELGHWDLLATRRVLGKRVSNQPDSKVIRVLGVKVPAGLGSRFFAVKVENNQVSDIRETPLPARVQDGFTTYPVDLQEPMSVLAREEGRSIFAVVPNQLVVTRVAPRGGEDHSDVDAERWDQATERFRPERVTAPYYAAVRLFHDNQQVTEDEFYLPYLGSAAGHDHYAAEYNVGPLTDMAFRLDRNLVSNSYTLEVALKFRAGPVSVKSQPWIGTFQPPWH